MRNWAQKPEKNKNPLRLREARGFLVVAEGVEPPTYGL